MMLPVDAFRSLMVAALPESESPRQGFDEPSTRKVGNAPVGADESWSPYQGVRILQDAQHGEEAFWFPEEAA